MVFKRKLTCNSDQDVAENVWCYCRDEEDGDMIACDNNDCTIKWFHISHYLSKNHQDTMWKMVLSRLQKEKIKFMINYS